MRRSAYTGLLFIFCLHAFFSSAAMAASAGALAPAQTVTPPSPVTVPPYIQKNPTSAQTTFDDLVRYKTRAQLQSYDDQYNASYLGQQIAVGMGDHVQMFNYQCGELVLGSNLSVPSTVTFPSQVAFSPGNQYLFAFSPVSSGGNGSCNLFQITGNSINTTGIVTPVDNCPIANGTVMAMSGVGDMMISLGVGVLSPYVRLWKMSGNHFYEVPAANNGLSPIVPTLTLPPTMISFSNDGNLLFLSDGTNTNLYARNSSDQYVQFGNGALKNTAQPTGMPAAPQQAAFSPDGKYLAVGSASGATVTIDIWRIDPGNVFVHVANPPNAGFPLAFTVSGTETVNAMTFSLDGKFLAVAGGDGGSGSGYVRMYKIDANDKFTVFTPNLGGYDSSPSVSALSFAHDSTYLTMVVAYTGSGSSEEPTILVANRFSDTNWGVYSPLQPKFTGTYMPKSIVTNH